MKEGGEGDLVLPAQDISWMQPHWYKISLNWANGAHFRGTNLVNGTKHCQNAQHEDIHWYLRRLQQPEHGGLVQEQQGRSQTGGLSLPKYNFRVPLHLKISTSEMLQDTQKVAQEKQLLFIEKSFQIHVLCLLPLPGAKLTFTSPIKNC